MANERARQLRANQTDAERALWRQLREFKAEGFHFRRQAPIGPYIVDFVCHGANLVVEVDGGQHAEDDEIEKDLRRTEWLEGRGYRVIRFWNHEVLGNIEGVWDVVRGALVRATIHPTPNPSPSRGGGKS